MLTYTFQYQHYYSFKDTSLYCIPGCVDVKQNFNCTFKVFKIGEYFNLEKKIMSEILPLGLFFSFIFLP